MALNAALRKKFANLRLLSLDTDGVLTDGGLYYTDAGDELRKFNVKDGMGMVRLRAAGVAIAIITASASPSIMHRARRLGVEHVFLEVDSKLERLIELCDKLGLDLDQVGHVGDDVNDLPVLESVGLPMSVADAVDNVKAKASYVAKRPGGHGAVREICDLILACQAN